MSDVRRMWMPPAQAAKLYLGISPEILTGAIKRGELPAYEKPLTRGRKEGAATEHHYYFVNLDDVDEWIRAWWPRAFSESK